MLTQVVTTEDFKAPLLKWRRHSGCLTSHDMREISTIARSILMVAVLVTDACVRVAALEVKMAQQISTNADQQKSIQTLTASLKEQAWQIQKVSAQLAASKVAPPLVVSNQ